MPTYAYRCKNCNHSFDIVQSFSDDSLTTCPECAGTLRKIFGNVGVAFKGSGFYRNDSRESGSTQSAASNGNSAGDSSDSASKPAEKSAEGKPSAAPAETSKPVAAASTSSSAATS